MNLISMTAKLISSCVKHKGWNNCPYCGRELILKQTQLICSNYEKDNYHKYNVNVNYNWFVVEHQITIISGEQLEISGLIFQRTIYGIALTFIDKGKNNIVNLDLETDLLIAPSLTANKMKKLLLLQ